MLDQILRLHKEPPRKTKKNRKDSSDHTSSIQLSISNTGEDSIQQKKYLQLLYRTLFWRTKMFNHGISCRSSCQSQL